MPTGNYATVRSVTSSEINYQLVFLKKLGIPPPLLATTKDASTSMPEKKIFVVYTITRYIYGVPFGYLPF